MTHKRNSLAAAATAVAAKPFYRHSSYPVQTRGNPRARLDDLEFLIVFDHAKVVVCRGCRCGGIFELERHGGPGNLFIVSHILVQVEILFVRQIFS